MSLRALTDTIAAIATPHGIGSVAIVRLSGSATPDILKKMTTLTTLKPNMIQFTRFLQANQTVMDEGLVSFFKAPHSYTGDDVAELNCHGGYVVAKMLLERTIECGARLAGPGEFTQRAVVNGKLDLLQAEAVIDIIEAKTQPASTLSQHQLAGESSKVIQGFRQELLELIGHLEVHLDYPDEEDLHETADYTTQLATMVARIDDLLQSFQTGRVYREGVLMVITGKPNVGKSSLLNTLLKENRALVSEIPGTTRDTIEEWMQIEGVPFRLVDTAGIRAEVQDRVEAMGIYRAQAMTDQADIVLLVLDAKTGLVSDDERLLKTLQSDKTILIINKTDVTPSREQEMQKILQANYPTTERVALSLTQHRGLGELKHAIGQLVDRKLVKGHDITGPILSNERQQEKLWHARQSLQTVQESMQAGRPEDCWLIDLRQALQSLSEMMGQDVSDEILNHVFARFCVGK